MKAMGREIGTIHFVGIGGIGMSGIAEVMHHLGYKVQGSDMAESYVTEGLKKAGIPVMIGQSEDNLGDAAVVVCSTAIRDDNPEVRAAAERRIPRVRRAELEVYPVPRIALGHRVLEVREALRRHRAHAGIGAGEVVVVVLDGRGTGCAVRAEVLLREGQETGVVIAELPDRLEGVGEPATRERHEDR